MTSAKARAVESAFIAACEAELRALKPGNVHIFAAGHGMETAHFERAARAAAPFLADETLALGERIWRATDASVAIANCNTNLGILLLSVPLAAAALSPPADAPLRDRLLPILDHLSVEDAGFAFRAIVRANPAGLGSSPEGDVAAHPTITFRHAMALAADRDRISRAYVTGYEDVFDVALPVLRTARARLDREDLAITALHMHLLAAFRDSHILRKFGAEMAESVREEAYALKPLAEGTFDAGTIEKLLEFDASLKSRGLNPGTTADFVVATLFADALERL